MIHFILLSFFCDSKRRTQLCTALHPHRHSCLTSLTRDQMFDHWDDGLGTGTSSIVCPVRVLGPALFQVVLFHYFNLCFFGQKTFNNLLADSLFATGTPPPTPHGLPPTPESNGSFASAAGASSRSPPRRGPLRYKVKTAVGPGEPSG